jgi:hypothetical protein
MAKINAILQLLRTSPFLAFRKEELTKIRQRCRSKKNIFVRFGYQWSDQKGSSRKELSIALRDKLRDLFGQATSDLPGTNYRLNYASLRAEAGKPVLHKIVFDILSADLLFFDTTFPNSNVFFEAGIAYAANANMFLLRSEAGKVSLPSDLAGLTYCSYRLHGGLHLDSSSESDIKARMKSIIRQKLEL